MKGKGLNGEKCRAKGLTRGEERTKRRQVCEHLRPGRQKQESDAKKNTGPEGIIRGKVI